MTGKVIRWRDGMGRITIKKDTAGLTRGSLVPMAEGYFGFVRADGWIQIYGPANVTLQNVPANGEGRERMAAKARYRRLQRHGPRAERSRGFGPRPDNDEWDD